jgi:hypothetical protein
VNPPFHGPFKSPITDSQVVYDGETRAGFAVTYLRMQSRFEPDALDANVDVCSRTM